MRATVHPVVFEASYAAVRAGADPGEIVLRNQMTWKNNVNLAQTKCVETEGQPLPPADSGFFDENIVARCDFAMNYYQNDDNWNTLQPSLSVVQHSVGKHPHAALRQPFVSGGDIFVYVQSELCFHAFRSFHLRAPSHSLHT